MLKHKIKMGLKQTVAGVGHATGAWRIWNGLSRKGRITVLTLHCVGYPAGTDYLPNYMKLAEDDFDCLLGLLARSFEIIDLQEAVRRLSAGDRGANAVVITLDDGYLDNRTHAAPILKKHGIPATIFLEASAVDRRSLSWINKYFFIHKHKGAKHYAVEYARKTQDENLAARLREMAGAEGNTEYRVKKIVKYEVDPVERDRITHEIFQDLGGDEQSILNSAFLSWDDVKAMAADQITFGCHTMTHPILSTLTREEAQLEILESRKLIESKGGFPVDTFAYPWGRAWDFNQETMEVLKEQGFTCGLAMDETAALPGTCDLYNLSRYPLAEGFSTADILAVASGLYGWFGV